MTAPTAGTRPMGPTPFVAIKHTGVRFATVRLNRGRSVKYKTERRRQVSRSSSLQRCTQASSPIGMSAGSRRTLQRRQRLPGPSGGFLGEAMRLLKHSQLYVLSSRGYANMQSQSFLFDAAQGGF